MNQYNGFTPRAAAALEGAQRAAQQAGHTYIGSEHLLLRCCERGPERLIRCFFSGV